MTDLTLVIGNKNYSSWSLRPWLALKQTGQSFREELVVLRQPDTKARILAHSAAGKVPVLKHGAIVVWESLAICEYLSDTFPAARLWPADSAARAHARAISNEMHAGFAELRKNMPMDIRGDRRPDSRAHLVQGEVERICQIWREARQRFGSRAEGAFLYGAFTIADAMFAPVATRFRTYGVALDDVCQRYLEAVLDWPAFREWEAAARAETQAIDFEIFRQPR
ncbi:MAG: glutathione S-transferase family protein [Rhodospirillaceae bacterium]|nr:glutathione S-transferase family protein [Rhodospirillaceae bacterium]